jgi:two-component system OmpR family response regulator
MVLRPADRGNPPSGESSRSVEPPLPLQAMDAPSAASSVLVVDDEPQVVWVLQFSLEAEGYETFTATNGLEAMAQISEHHPSLMVLDVMMPRMDGWSVLEALLKLPVEERPRVVMVTALASLRDRTKAAELGAAAYVPKPFDLDELLEVLHGLEQAS